MPDLTLVIGNKNYSSWSLRPWLALRMAGLPFKEVRIPPTARWPAVGPAGRSPAAARVLITLILGQKARLY
jgi:glutathione S-transferase